jgi:hypothetical protein
MAHYFVYHSNSAVFYEWCKLLLLAQGMDKATNIRISEGHAEYDSDRWIPAFVLDLDLMNILSLGLEGANYKDSKQNQSKFPYAIGACLKLLQQWLYQTFNLPVDYKGKVDEIEFQVSKGATSYHIPLHRSLAALLHEGMKTWSLRLEEMISVPDRQQLSLLLVEHPLRIFGTS